MKVEAINVDGPRGDDCCVESQSDSEPKEKNPHEKESEVEGVRSSKRNVRPPQQYNPTTGGSYLQALKKTERIHNIRINDILGSRTAEYGLDTGKVIARNIHHLRNEIFRQETSYATQYMLKRGLKVFGEQGVVASKAELTQMHQRVCFKPELIKNLSELERKCTMKGLMILTQKRDGKQKED